MLILHTTHNNIDFADAAEFLRRHAASLLPMPAFHAFIYFHYTTSSPHHNNNGIATIAAAMLNISPAYFFFFFFFSQFFDAAISF